MTGHVKRDLIGLEDLGGAVVILDVFRASNTVLAALAAGASEVLLVADVAAAIELKRAHPRWLLLGERGGVALPGFDGGNSPVEAAGLVRPGATVVLTTSAGTQAAHRLGRADPVLVGSFANAAALVGQLSAARDSRVTLLPMGLEAREPALEDDLAASYLRLSLDGSPPPFEPLRQQLLACPGADRLRRLGQHEDLLFCTQLDSHEQVPRVVPGDPPRAVLRHS